MGLRAKALAFMLLFGLLPLLILGLAAGRSSASLLERQLRFNSSRTLDTMAAFLAGQLRDLVTLTGELSRNAVVLRTLQALDSGGPGAGERDPDGFSAVRGQFIREEFSSRFLQPYHYILLASDGTVFTPLTSTAAATARSRYPALFSLPRLATDSPSYAPVEGLFRAPHLYSPLGGEQIYCVRSVREGVRTLGLVLVGMSVSGFERLMEDYRIEADTSLFLYDDEGERLLSRGSSFSVDQGRRLLSRAAAVSPSATDVPPLPDWLEGRRLFAGVRRLPLTPRIRLSFLSLTPWSSVFSELRGLNVLRWVLIAYSAASLLLLIAYMQARIITPVFLLHRTMRKVDGGDFSARAPVRVQGELGDLARSFNGMVQGIAQSIDRIKRDEREKRDLELILLQEQIKPHFTKNTLNTIRLMADIRGARAVSKALSAFIAILDYAQKSGESLVPLAAELANLEQYMYLSSLRFQDKCSLELRVEPAHRELLLPRLCLQPLVENSIVHGILPMQGIGRITVESSTTAEALILRVTDTGVGMDGGRLQEIGRLLEESGGPGRGVGLPNVHRRIRLAFGPPHGLEAERGEAGGVAVTLRLPLLRQEGTR